MNSRAIDYCFKNIGIAIDVRVEELVDWLYHGDERIVCCRRHVLQLSS